VGYCCESGARYGGYDKNLHNDGNVLYAVCWRSADELNTLAMQKTNSLSQYIPLFYSQIDT
jgi:hypothetical protein